MELRTLGTGDAALTVSAAGLGCLGLTMGFGPTEEAESIATIHAALDAGVNYLDTSDAYGPFRNEELVGRAIAGRRDEVVVATKFGLQVFDGPRVVVNGDPAYVRACCDASLARLGIDHIDLYTQHRVDPDVPVEETWGALSELVTAGKVGHLGLSEAPPETIRRAHAVHPVTALQSEWSLWSRDVEDNQVLATVRELGIGFVAFGPLGRGFLTGKVRNYDALAPDDVRRSSPRYQGENLVKNLRLLDQVELIAKAKGITLGQLALAWLLAQGPDVVPIPGALYPSHVVENLEAVGVTLTESDLAAIATVLPKGSFA